MKKIKAEEIAQSHWTNAYKFAERQLTICKTGEYVALDSSIAVPEFVEMLTVAEMKEACTTINAEYGELKKLVFVEILRHAHSYIYRYKADFSKTSKQIEVRVGTDFNNKFIGLMFKDGWFDKYYQFNEKPKGYKDPVANTPSN